jgi:AAA15 family ATPase/GTPase
VLKAIEIKNFKSISQLELTLGRVNVFIGENGAGKSNILEAIALAGAASAEKLDNEFLSARGVRVTSPTLMRAAFNSPLECVPVKIKVIDHSDAFVEYSIENDNAPYSKWEVNISTNVDRESYKSVLHELTQFAQEKDKATKAQKDIISFIEQLKKGIDKNKNKNIAATVKRRKTRSTVKETISVKLEEDNVIAKMLVKATLHYAKHSSGLSNFIIFSPENSSLKLFQKEGQVEPLGINGEGLLKLLAVMEKDEKEAFIGLQECLKILSWFEGFDIVNDAG